MDNMGGGAPVMGSDPNMMGGAPMGNDPNMMGGDPNAMGGAPMGDDPNMMGGDPNAMGGDPMAAGNEGFDMGIGMTPEEDPRKWIEGAAAKLASELRKYQSEQPAPDMSLNKTAVNTVAAATRDNLQGGQRDELMKSYADTMRNGDENGEGGDNAMADNGGDAGADMGGDPNAMGNDPNAMGGDPNAMGGEPALTEARVNALVNELVGDLIKTRKKSKPAAEVKHQDDSTYVMKPYTRKNK